MNKWARETTLLVIVLLFTAVLLPANALQSGYRGVVDDRDTGIAIVGARIVFESENGSLRREVVSDENGVYQIELPAGRYRVTATHPDYITYSTESGFFIVSDTAMLRGDIYMSRRLVDDQPEQPEDVVPWYFDLVRDREYDTAWSLLTPRYQCYSGTQSSYEAFWDSYQKIEISVLDVSRVISQKAVVETNLTLTDYDNDTNDVHVYYQMLQDPDGIWLFDDGTINPGGRTSSIRDECEALALDFPDAAATCGGQEIAGYCWYFGGDSQSCDAVCSAQGGYHEATRIYAGSDGNARNCRHILQSFGLTLDDFFDTRQGGIGCFTIRTSTGNYYGYWDQHPTTASAVYGLGGRRRICACQH